MSAVASSHPVPMEEMTLAMVTSIGTRSDTFRYLSAALTVAAFTTNTVPQHLKGGMVRSIHRIALAVIELMDNLPDLGLEHMSVSIDPPGLVLPLERNYSGKRILELHTLFNKTARSNSGLLGDCIFFLKGRDWMLDAQSVRTVVGLDPLPGSTQRREQAIIQIKQPHEVVDNATLKAIQTFVDKLMLASSQLD